MGFGVDEGRPIFLFIFRISMVHIGFQVFVVNSEMFVSWTKQCQDIDGVGLAVCCMSEGPLNRTFVVQEIICPFFGV